MVAKFGQQVLVDLTDRSGTGLIDVSVLNTAIAAAEAKVNGYIAGRYAHAMPFTVVPQAVIDASLAIARYELDGDNGNAIVQQRHDDAVAFLKDVSMGKAVLAGVDAVVEPSTTSAHIEFQSASSVFARGVR